MPPLASPLLACFGSRSHRATMIIILSADREAQTEWALGIKNSIANYLQDGPDGKFYYRMVDTVLSRDKNWVRWKMENCQSFTRDRVPAKDFVESKSGAQNATRLRKAPKPTTAPRTLQFLSNTEPEKGLSQLRQQDRWVPLARRASHPTVCVCAHGRSGFQSQARRHIRRGFERSS